jgi:hypothetical protein
MPEKMSFRELHGIERDPRWPHVEGCTGGCMGCGLEDAVLAAGGTAGRDWLLLVLTAAPPIPESAKPAPKPRKAK